ncbi:MAG: glycosyltransferase [Fidelibacterota bacterium]
MNYCPTVDVVIPCYNVAHVVEKCVRSVINQEYDNTVKIYLVNDGSTDHTAELLGSFSNQSNITVIHHERNKGLASSRNSGIRAGNGDVICFLDSDMVVKQNWIKMQTQVLSNNNVVGVIGDSKMPKNEKINSLDKYLYDKRRGARRFEEGEPINFQYFLFNNTAVRRSVFEIIDLFDENITMYGGEDTELAIRLWEAYPDSLRFSLKAVSEHHHKRSFGTFCESMFQYGKTNLPSLITQYPQYTNHLGGQWIHSIKGYSLFNPILRFGVQKTHRFCDHYWLSRYLVVDAVIRGARSSSVENST